MSWEHEPVMVAEVLTGLALTPRSVVVDGTVGMGGHSLALLAQLGSAGRLIGLDLDLDALAVARSRLAEGEFRVVLVHESFANLAAVVQQHAPEGVDAILLDLGVSRDQLVGDRFSFRSDAPLDFRLDPTHGETAAQLLARLSQDELAHLLEEHGDERFARRIAAGVVQARSAEPIETTGQLVEIIRRAYPPKARHGRIHIATRSFQALRVACNGMMAALDRVLDEGPALLRPGGRLAVLAYHSGEDRRAKHRLRDWAATDGYRLVTRRPLMPSEDECRRNPSARSARLRVLEAQGEGGQDELATTG